MPLPQHSLAVVGIDYPNRRGPSRAMEVRLCAPGEPVALRPEPTNPADPRAVAVYSVRGVQIGYVPAERAPRLAALLQRGTPVAAIFQALAHPVAWIRIAYDGDVPILPSVPPPTRAPSPPPGQDFWPDPEWPDDP